METDKQHAYQLIERLAPGQLAAIVQLLEVMVLPAAGEDEEPFTEEDRRAVAASREWFQANPEGIPFERLVTDCRVPRPARRARPA